jgi:hypothetical protein
VTSGGDSQLKVSFCGETYRVDRSSSFTIGRDGELRVDDNPFLHRRFLILEFTDGMWWIANIGSQLAATVADVDGLMEAWLAPNARLPLVFGSMLVRFTAGAFTYEVDIEVPEPPFIGFDSSSSSDGVTTIAHLPMTSDQRLLILTLAEDVLRNGWRSGAAVPTSAEAASRLGWNITKFNRKLDNV